MSALDQCRRYEGLEEGFWPLFTEALLTAAGASHVLLLRRTIDPLEAWKPFAAWPAKEKFPLGAPLDDASLTAALEAAVREEVSEFRVPADPKIRLPIASLDAGHAGQQMVALFKFSA